MQAKSCFLVRAARSKAGTNMDDAASASGVSTMTNDDDEAVQLLGQPGWEQEVDSDFEREFAQLVGAPAAGKYGNNSRKTFTSHDLRSGSMHVARSSRAAALAFPRTWLPGVGVEDCRQQPPCRCSSRRQFHAVAML